MSDSIEFNSFYKLLNGVIKGDKQNKKELDWLLAEYEHAREATSAYDEIGQIFCHHGIMELYEYAGTDDISYITTLDKSVWEYLNVRIGDSPKEYMVKSMLGHAKSHHLCNKVSEKWGISNKDIEDNIEDLAKYVVDGILDLILN